MDSGEAPPYNPLTGVEMGDLTGQRIGRYELLEVLGTGGMGVVYRGQELVGGRPVAIKFVLPSMLDDEIVRRRLEVEVRAVSQLNHPNIATVYEHFSHENGTALVMELLEGGSLRSRISGEGMRLEEILAFGVQMADGLAHAHDRGVIHRDVKPDNVLFDGAGVPKITDFGIAKLVHPTGSDAPTLLRTDQPLTATGTLLGTPHYMSPEAAVGRRVDFRTDIYSLGVVLFHMASGRLPFTGPSFGAVLRAIGSDHPVPVRATRPDFPAELEAVIQRAMARELSHRFQAMEDMAEAMRRIASAGGASGHPALRPRLPEMIAAGRTVELATLEELLDEALDGTGRTVFLAGEAGIGKAHLVALFARRAAVRGAQLASGRCLLRDGARPYGPVLDALVDALAAFDVRDAEELEQFLGEAVFPKARLGLVASLLRLSGAPYESAGSAEELFDSLALLVLALTQHGPLVLHIEDLHWADAATLRLFAHLSQVGHRARLLLLASFSPEELQAEPPAEPPLAATLISRLASDPHVRQVTIGPLDVGALRTLVQELHPLQRASDGFLERLRQMTSGNPALVLEALQNLGLPRPAGEMLSERDLVGIEVPRQIQTLVIERVGRLDQSERELLELAAVTGETFYSDTLAECLGISRIPLLRKLQHLEQNHGLIRSGRDAYRFTSGLVREALYERLPRELRREFHRAVGEQLAAARGQDEEHAAAIAHQFFEGDLPERALPYAITAGTRSRRLFATEDALHWLSRAEEIALGLPSPDARDLLPRVREELGAVHVLTGNYFQATACFEAARRSAGERGDAEAACRCLNALGQVHFLRNDQPRAEEAARGALALAEDAGLLEQVATARTTLADVRWDQGRLDESLSEHRAALALRERLGNARQTVESLKRMANVHQVRGEHREALASFDRALSIARDIGDLAAEAFVLNGIGGVLLSAGRTVEAIPRLTEALEIRERILDRRGASKSLNNLGLAFEMRGRTADALTHYERSLDVKRELDDRNGVANSLINIASLQERMGRYDVALGSLAEAQAIKEALGSRKEIPQCLASQARILCTLHLAERALPLAERAVAMAEEVGAVREQSTALAVLGTALEATGRFAEASSAYERAVEVARSGQAEDEEFHARRHLARLAIRLGSESELPTQVERLRALAGALDLPECHVHLLWLEAAAAASEGRVADALRSLRDATALAEETGLPALAWRLHHAAARLHPPGEAHDRAMGHARTILSSILAAIGDPSYREGLAAGADEQQVLHGTCDVDGETAARPDPEGDASDSTATFQQ